MSNVEIPKGYKQTELGLIPEDWDIDEIDNVGLFKKGKGIKKDEVKFEGLPCVRYGELYTRYNNHFKETHSFISKETSKDSQEIKNGDLLFAGSGETSEEIGKCATYMGNKVCFAGGDVIILTPYEDNPIYLGYLMNNNTIVKQKSSFAQGDAVVHIYPNSLKKILIPLPPKPEQEAIANVLSNTDELIQSLEQLVNKKKKIKEATMQQLLTGKKRLVGFEGEWEVKKLGEISDMLKGSGLSKTKLNIDGKYKCLLYGELFTTYKYLIKEIKNRTNFYEGTPSKIGDILMPASTTTIGVDLATASTISEDNVLLGGDVNIIRPNAKNISSLFMSYYLTEVKKYKIAEITQGITIIHLYGRNLKDLDLKIPKSLKEQEAIANILSDMDNEITSLNQKLNKYKQIKEAQMQQLLTGKIRLI